MAKLADDNPPAREERPGISTASSASRRTGGRPDKHRAITDAARTVFGRDGYVRTSIDAIAAEAGVSTRTIYNHFAGKEQLFSAVLHASAAQVADGFLDTVERELTGADLERDLIALGHAFAAQSTAFPEHFAMVRQIRAEAPHFPRAIIDAWQQAGPLRVQGEVARRLRQLAADGLLRICDPSRAAIHFSALVTAGIPIRPYDSSALSERQTRDIVTAGVDAFLNGYGAEPRPRAVGGQP
jgi:AcrR family transcriptional regulator